MNHPTFKVHFCVTHNVTSEEFDRIIFNRSLYPHARFLKWLLFFYDPAYFDADIELITSVGPLSRVRDFSSEADHYNIHLGNRGFLRRKFRLRVSTNRLRCIMKETLGHHRHTSPIAKREQGFSAVPFGKPILNVQPAKHPHADSRLQMAQH